MFRRTLPARMLRRSAAALSSTGVVRYWHAGSHWGTVTDDANGAVYGVHAGDILFLAHAGEPLSAEGNPWADKRSLALGTEVRYHLEPMKPEGTKGIGAVPGLKAVQVTALDHRPLSSPTGPTGPALTRFARRPPKSAPDAPRHNDAGADALLDMMDAPSPR
jgi:hypothetical protein